MNTRSSARFYRLLLLACLTMLLLAPVGGAALAQTAAPEKAGQPDVVPMIGPVSMDQDLRTLPVTPPTNNCPPRLSRHPFSQSAEAESDAPAADFVGPVQPTFASPAMPGPAGNYLGMTWNTSNCSCWPPDTNGDVSFDYYIQATNESIQIFNKTGVSQSGPTSFNSFFSTLTGTPCAANNSGDPIVFWDSLANRWVVTDMAFPAFPGTSFYQCIGVSKTSNPISGGWWLYALQIDPNNTNYLGDYPKMVLWRDAYYLSVNLFSNNTTFNGVRVFALDRSKMINGTGAPTPSYVAFSITPATLGDAYSLVPATFRYGGPATGTPEYFLAINSSATADTVENQVFAWRFHVDWTTPANSTFGVGANHTPDGTISVNNFVDAFTTARGTNIIRQLGTTVRLDTLGDKIMYPVVYQKLNGVESLYAAHTVNNAAPIGVRWYQFTITGDVIPATPTQQQTYTPDSTSRWMPSLALDRAGNLAIGYSASSTAIYPDIRYAGRLTTDPLSTLGQGEATLQAGGGYQSTYNRWGDYTMTSIDPSDGCTFWHTNEYLNASGTVWYTRFGKFNYTTAQCSPLAITLASMAAAQQGDSITVTWETVSEVGNTGFNLYRDSSPAGPGTKINRSLIPSQAPGSSSGFTYEYTDADHLVSNTTYYYWLEDVNEVGLATRHEPVSVLYTGQPTAVRLAAFGGRAALPALPVAGLLLAALTAAIMHRHKRSTRLE